MDEDAYRETYWQLNQNQCVFEKTILTNQCACSKVKRLYLAEREAAQCTHSPSRFMCQSFLDIVGKHAEFALKSRHEGHRLPHAKAVKLQMGALRGLYAVFYPQTSIPVPIPDVYELLTTAKNHFGSFKRLPIQQLLPHIAQFQIKKRRGRKKN